MLQTWTNKRTPVHINFLIILFLVQLWGHEFWRSYDAHDSAHSTTEGGKSKITNLNNSSGTIYEYIIWFQVPVNNWRVMPVEVDKPLKDLPSPALYAHKVDIFMFPSVPG